MADEITPQGQHLETNITKVYNGLDVSFASYPADNVGRDAEAYRAAIDALAPGDAVTIFTLDTTHYAIALYAIERGVHVLLTKPAVKTLADHQALLEAAAARNRQHPSQKVFVYVEHHKRFDPAYADARYRAERLGDARGSGRKHGAMIARGHTVGSRAR